jgi:hydrogenase maturation factor
MWSRWRSDVISYTKSAEGKPSSVGASAFTKAAADMKDAARGGIERKS